MENVSEKNELVLLVESSGLEVNKQNQISDTLGSFFNKAKEWDKIISDIVITSPEEIGKMKMAKEGRLTLKNMRLEGEKIIKLKRDEVKARMANDILEDKLWLKAGQMMEAVYKNLETKLEEKEKFAERWEIEQREKLKAQRLSEINELGIEFESGFDLSTMDENTYQALKLGLLESKKKQEEEIKRIEEERIAEEKRQAEEREKQRIENERLKKEAAEREKALEEERKKAEEQRKQFEEKAKKEREAAEAKLKAEREEREKAERELKAIEDAKKEEEQRNLAEEKKKKSASDKIKLIDLHDKINALEFPELKSEEAKNILKNTKLLLDKVKVFIKEKSNTL